MSTIYLAINPLTHIRIKFLNITFYYVCEKVFNSTIQIQYIPYEFQLIDLLTKSLFTTQFTSIRDKLQVTKCRLAIVHFSTNFTNIFSPFLILQEHY